MIDVWDEGDELFGVKRPTPKRARKPLDDLSDFAKKNNFTITSTTGGKHNAGSLHYQGRAIDIRSRDKNEAQINALKNNAALQGFVVRDERTRPANQKVWGGPHLHLEVGSRKTPAPTNDVWAEGDKLFSDNVWDEGDKVFGSPAPETPQTIQAQIESLRSPKSPKAAVLLTDPAQEQALAPDLAKRYERVETPQGILYVNKLKANAQGIFDYQKNLARLIGKVDDVGNNTQGSALLTKDANGNELSSSIVTNPQSAEMQAQVDQQSYPQAASQEIVDSNDVVQQRYKGLLDAIDALPENENVGATYPVQYPTKTTGSVAPPEKRTAKRPARRYVGTEPQMVEEETPVVNPPVTGQKTLGKVEIDPSWSDEEKVRFAAKKVLLGKHTPTGPITEQDIEDWIAKAKATGDPRALITAPGDRKETQFSVGEDMFNQIYNSKRKSLEQLQEEEKQRAIAPPSEDMYRAQALDELRAERQTEQLQAQTDRRFGGASEPSTEITEDQIQNKIAEIKSKELTQEEKSRSYDVAQKIGSLEGGLYGGAGSILQTAGGVQRILGLGNSVGRLGREMGSASGYRNRGQGAQGSVENLGQFVGETLPALGELMVTPGGAVIKFAALGGLKAAGGGGDVAKIGQETVKGAATGALFEFSQKLENPIAKLGTVFGGTVAIDTATGAPIDQSFKNGIVNTLFEAQGVYGKRIAGKFFQFWKGGEPITVGVTPKGEVVIPRREVKTENKVVLDPENPVYEKIPESSAPVAKKADVQPAEIAPPKTKIKTAGQEGFIGTKAVVEPPAAEKVNTSPSKVGKGIEAKAIKERMVGEFEKTAQYEHGTFDQWSQVAADLINNDLKKAKRIMSGEEPLPRGVNGSFLIKGLSEYAQKTNDVKLLQDLANSKLVAETSKHAQELGGLRGGNWYDPVNVIKEVQNVREKAVSKRGKLPKEADVISEIKAEKTKAAPKPKDWASFVDSLRC